MFFRHYLYFLPLFFIIGCAGEDPLLLPILHFQFGIFFSQCFIDVLQIINLLVEDIHIGEEVVVLFFALDEGVLNFLDVGEPSRFFDGGEGLINNFHVPLIGVNKFDFFLVIDDEFGQSLAKEGGSVILDGGNLSCFDATALEEFGILEISVEFVEGSVVLGFLFLVFHLELGHFLLVHLAHILGLF